MKNITDKQYWMQTLSVYFLVSPLNVATSRIIVEYTTHKNYSGLLFKYVDVVIWADFRGPTHFSNTLVHINKTTVVSNSENYFYTVDTKCQMAMLHYHKQDSKHNRVVN